MFIDLDECVAKSAHIAVYVPTLAGGGAELSMLRLAGALAERGYIVDLLLNRRVGAYVERIPANVNVVELARYGKWRARLDVWRARPADWKEILRPVLTARVPIMSLRYLGGLTDYLRACRPSVLVATMFYSNLLAIWARDLAGCQTRVVVTEHDTLSRRITEGRRHQREATRWRYLSTLLGRVYRRADAIVTVSNGVGDDLAKIAGLVRTRITTIYNPVVFPELLSLAAVPLDHPWFVADSPPVLVAVGRLEPQKDFDMLLAAFAAVRAQRPVRLVILGEGGRRAALERLIKTLGAANDVSLPGWVDNPYAYMAKARLFVLSSRREGLGNVLIEAMACGCPVVSTDCESGPREILANGRHGTLVPVGNASTLAEAIEHALDHPVDADDLRRRADGFSVRKAAERYEALIQTPGGR